MNFLVNFFTIIMVLKTCISFIHRLSYYKTIVSSRNRGIVSFGRFLSCKSEFPYSFPSFSSSNSVSDSLSAIPLAENISSSPFPTATKKPTKIRQHVNPLASHHLTSLNFENDWLRKTFPFTYQNRFLIDIGCGKGGFLLKCALKQPEMNFLGLEIRQGAVDHCDFFKEKHLNPKNLYYLSCNVNTNLENILKLLQDENERQYQLQQHQQQQKETEEKSSDKVAEKAENLKLSSQPQQELQPNGQKFSFLPLLSTITIQFPDPHFKKRNYKRRVLNTELMEILSKYSYLNDTKLFIQSDVKDIMMDMMEHIRNSSYFSPVSGYDQDRIENNVSPFKEENNIQTDREIYCQNKGLPIYRMLYQRNGKEYIERQDLQRKKPIVIQYVSRYHKPPKG
jgi:tRNA (guanine-N7-)-methyltransferase